MTKAHWCAYPIAALFAVAACSSTDDGTSTDDPRKIPESAPTATAEPAIPEAPTGPTGPPAIELTFEVELDEGSTIADVVTMIERRIEQRQPTSVEVDSAADAVVIRLPAMPDAELERAWRRLVRRAEIAYRLVDEGSDLMRRIYGHAGEDARATELGIEALVDRWDHAGKSYSDFYLAAKDRDVLAQYLAELSRQNATMTADDAHLIAFSFDHAPPDRPGPEWRSYYVSRAASLAMDAIQHSELRFNPQSRRAQALITFTKEGTQTLATLTRENVGKKLAIFVDEAIVSAPVIMGEIPGGQMVMSSGGDPQTAKRDAEELVELLKLGTLPARLTLVSTKQLESSTATPEAER